jgi:DNA-binding HxlR family transcriptional regulator
MPKAEKKLKPSKSNILNKDLSQHKVGDKRSREINQKIILKQLRKLKRKGLITEKEFNNKKKQIFGSNKKGS